MVDRELLEKKKKLQEVRNILKTFNGVKILCIYEKSDAVLERISENLSEIGYFSNSKKPDSKISINANDSLIYQWINENMKLKNNDILFLLCHGIWIKMQIIDIMNATQSLWNNSDGSKGFTVLNEDMDKLLEVGEDFRDELNYLFDEYSIPVCMEEKCDGKRA